MNWQLGRRDRKNYDADGRNKANLHAALRGFLALYLFHLAWDTARGASSQTAVPEWAGLLLGAFFLAAGGLYAFYALRCYLKEMADAELPDAPEEPDEPADVPGGGPGAFPPDESASAPESGDEKSERNE